MNSFSFVILYVADVAKSVAFYSDLLNIEPVSQSPGFAMFALGNGQKFGLWAAGELGSFAGPAGGAEYSLTAANDAEVTRIHDAWAQKGIAIAQPPAQLPFGFTFVANDPDGHHIRVYSPAAA